MKLRGRYLLIIPLLILGLWYVLDTWLIDWLIDWIMSLSTGNKIAILTGYTIFICIILGFTSEHKFPTGKKICQIGIFYITIPWFLTIYIIKFIDKYPLTWFDENLSINTRKENYGN